MASTIWSIVTFKHSIMMTEIILNDLQFCVLCVFCSDCLLFQCFIQEMIPQLSLNEIFQPTNVETNKEISAQ